MKNIVTKHKEIMKHSHSFYYMHTDTLVTISFNGVLHTPAMSWCYRITCIKCAFIKKEKLRHLYASGVKTVGRAELAALSFPPPHLYFPFPPLAILWYTWLYVLPSPLLISFLLTITSLSHPLAILHYTWLCYAFFLYVRLSIIRHN